MSGIIVVEKVKILFIHHGIGWGGAPLNMMNIINGLDKSRYDIEVLLIHDSIVKQILNENGIKVQIAEGNFYKKFYSCYVHSDASLHNRIRIDIKLRNISSWILNRFFYAKRQLKKHQFDIVHLNSSFLIDWLAPCRARGKVIIHVQEPFSLGHFGLQHSFFMSQMKKYADAIIAISNDNAMRINLPEKTHVVYNFTTIPKEEDLRLDSGTNNILYLGGYHENKGFFTIVKALDHLDKDIRILFCGDFMVDIGMNDARYILKEKIKSYLPFHRRLKAAMYVMNNHPNAVLIGFVNDPTQLIQSSELLISPFLKPHFSRPIIEAFAHRKCAIGTDVSGMDEIIENEVDGLIIKKDDPLTLAQSINYLHKNPLKRAEMGEKAYLKAKKLFSPSNVLKIQEIYDFTINKD